ncbi:TPA: hypothetical protein ACGZ9U_000936 [Elizabethkingia anophelis]
MVNTKTIIKPPFQAAYFIKHIIFTLIRARRSHQQGKYPGVSPYVYVNNNPIKYIDPNGMVLDISRIMENKEQYKAFVLFAKTKEGQQFLSQFMQKGQKIEYGGKTIYEASSDGYFHSKGTNLVYANREDKNNTGSYTYGENNGKGLNILVALSHKPFGKSESFIFNTVEHIAHESFFHVLNQAKDWDDDGYSNNSQYPKEYKKYDELFGSQHSDHKFISDQFLKDPATSDVNKVYNILNQVSKQLNLKLGATQIKSQIWEFSGSGIKLDKNGKEIKR